MWKAVFAVLGGVVGPVVGYFTAYYLTLVSEKGSCMDTFLANALGWVFGVPIGAVAFCFLGLGLGFMLDARSRHNGSNS